MELFISYSSDDLKKIIPIVSLLRVGGHVPWFDEKLVAGQDWKQTLKEAIVRSDAFIYMITPQSLASEWCRWELNNAVLLNKPIIPILVEAAELPGYLSHLQYADFTRKSDNEAIAKLLGGLGEITQIIPKENVPAAADNPSGEPAHRVSQTISGTNTGTIIGQQHNTTIEQKSPGNWSVPVVLGLILAGLALLIGLLTDDIREGVLYSIGLIPATSTPAGGSAPPTTLGDRNMGVIVAHFALPTDSLIDTSEADMLALRLANRLEPELQEAASTLGVTLGFLGPEDVGRISGVDALEREENARDLARKYRASIVIYGEIKRNVTTGQFDILPEYYIAPRSFYDALEITGSTRFGDEISIDPPISNALEVEQSLSARVTALAKVMTGLVSYAAGNYDAALRSIENAKTVPGWNIETGHEVLNVLSGNIRLRLARQPALACKRDEVLGWVDSAIYEFNQAINEAPGYARAYTGLASATYIRATWTPQAREDCQEDVIDREQVVLSLAYIATAQAVKEQPQEVGVRTRQLMVEAQAQFMLWLTDPHPDSDDARQLYNAFIETTEQIIRFYEEGDTPEIGELVVEVYVMRGLGLQTQDVCRAALTEFDNALAIPELVAERRMYITGWKGDCYSEMQQLERAVESYEVALAMARELEHVKQIVTYETALAALDATIQGQ